MNTRQIQDEKPKATTQRSYSQRTPLIVLDLVLAKPPHLMVSTNSSSEASRIACQLPFPNRSTKARCARAELAPDVLQDSTVRMVASRTEAL